mmetsp:Transcript_20783/g.34778  ORF Transcript_20783/g.34778 Transcript_20783/m.34778 type:complete len:259 (-) Transcript_20783:341-1117(-)|eukprot:CAMPEP_0198212956 /NCGR_PEP_ID=MMETSP1445-20131203/28403_1 /TAXON_ID=36898 /ORGANISM="Pyramimonas sp., Strain CCMP2087" /LENGTH=258 /DNA_ID=CAMNT_0043887533 /DNA_START=77 /DNA_END=853 /DNA_ORIENTATION=+
MGDSHPHSGYNKYKLGTLTGNWVEEHALEKATGNHRYNTWVPPPNQESEDVYGQRTNGPEYIPTNERVFLHTLNADFNPWRSHTQDVHRHPQKHGETGCMVYLNTKNAGRRTELMKKAHENIAKDLPPDPGFKDEFITTNMELHDAKDMSELCVGRRVMKTRDGEPIGLENRDPTFLAETGIRHKSAADRMLLGPVDSSAVRDLSKDALTIYSTEALNGTYGNGCSANGTKWTGTNPHAKTSNFSRPMTDSSKVVTDE